jgi:hypothetical protein
MGDARRHSPRGRGELACEGCHGPHPRFAGAPPARSALTFRLVLAGFGLVVCSLGLAALVTISDLRRWRDLRLPRRYGGCGHHRGGAPQAARRARLTAQNAASDVRRATGCNGRRGSHFGPFRKIKNIIPNGAVVSPDPHCYLPGGYAMALGP